MRVGRTEAAHRSVASMQPLDVRECTSPCLMASWRRAHLKKRDTTEEVVAGSACRACAAAVIAHTTMPSMPCGPMNDCMLRVRRKGTVSCPRSSWKRES